MVQGTEFKPAVMGLTAAAFGASELPALVLVLALERCAPLPAPPLTAA